ncbi:hypothetical protein VMCG_05715 [Cytospora schulzeri]|uniref:Uncharacterized protein n=1 Tax=Cytospora schulzeri TaxID=448051 RepID=A0A423WHV2_9PEZI|nr:hypothetical protein VMCG_05715 [Valsa malicola]
MLQDGSATKSSPQTRQQSPSEPHTVRPGGNYTYSDDSTLAGVATNRLDQTMWPCSTCDKQSKKEYQTWSPTFADDVKLRQEALDELLRRGRRKAEAEYLRTSDASVFDQYIAPFVAGKKNSKREWKLDQPTQRWYLYDPDTEEVLWCPTADSFA